MFERNKATHQHKEKSSEKLLNKEKILNSLNISEGQTILDAGCGNGYMAKEFARLVGNSGKVYAIDTDNASIEALKTTLETNIIEAFTGDITSKTKLNISSINLIYLSTVLHGFSANQLKGFIIEVRRLLKPKGTLAIVEIKKEKTPFGPPQSMRLSPDELKGKIPFLSKETVHINDYFYMQIFEKRL